MAAMDTFDVDDQRRLNLTQSLREDLVKSIMKKGMPEDNEERKLLLDTLGSMDRTTLTKAKIKADEKANGDNKQMTAMVAQLLMKVNPNSFVVEGQSERVIEPPQLSGPDSEVNPLPGETDIGTQAGDYDTFMKKFEEE